MLNSTPIRALKDNYIWLLAKGGRAVVVDPGEADPVLAVLEEQRLELVAILATHHHPDHIGGAPGLRAQTGARFLGPAEDGVSALDEAYREGDVAEIPELDARFEVLDIPGHTAGHIAFHGHGMVFCGDTLFSAGCGRLFEGTPAQMYRSLKKLSALDNETQVYCGHEYTLKNLRFAVAVEPDNAAARAARDEAAARGREGQPTLPSTIGREHEINPFLRCTQASVRKSASDRAGHTLTDPVEVFATIRSWKDNFS